MEFGEKLQQLRKGRGLTQEELAEALFVSRTAVSKWESGRGYPSIDSLKDISAFFSVSIDGLLSGEKLISIAEKENRENIRRICNFLFGGADLLSVIFIILPLYPNEAEGFIYSVSLFYFAQTSSFNLAVHWAVFILFMLFGAGKILLTCGKKEKEQNLITAASLILGIITVLYLSLTREAYAIAAAFILLTVKTALFIKMRKS